MFSESARPDGDSARALFWRIDSFAGPMKAVRKRNWKYVIDGNTQSLFDLDTDIGERHNAFATHPEVARELRENLADWERSLLAGEPSVGASR